MKLPLPIIAFCFLLVWTGFVNADDLRVRDFDFRDDSIGDYDEALGYGWETDSTKSVRRFSLKLPEGNHRVTVSLGHASDAAVTTIKAELRRLMVEALPTQASESKEVTFIVNTRGPEYGEGREVRLKDRERASEWITWDDKLTLEFIETAPALQRLVIEPAPNLPMLYLLGDSTMCDQPVEPYASWGQMLTRFFGPKVALANHGESGESYSASLGRGRLNKVIDVMKPGDYLFLQFAHNDMKERGEGKGAFLNFKVGMEKHIAAAREKGGIPVLITPMHRRRFDSDGKVVNTFGDYPEAVRQTAREMKLPLIDLLQLSAELYEALGAEGSSVLFKQGDGTHHNNYGAYQLAKCVVEGIRKAVPDVAHWLVSDLTSYSPAKPDPIGEFQVPASATVKANKPDGR